jgi:ribosomal protein L20
MIALHGTAHHVERLVRGYRRAQEAEELSREAQQHVNRSVTYAYSTRKMMFPRKRPRHEDQSGRARLT